RPDLGGRRLPGEATGGLQVNHHERGVEQRGAVVRQAELHRLPHGARTRIRSVDLATGAGGGEQSCTHPGHGNPGRRQPGGGTTVNRRGPSTTVNRQTDGHTSRPRRIAEVVTYDRRFRGRYAFSPALCLL